MKILVIDDIRDNLTVSKAVIKEAFPEASVYLAINGKDGIELALTVDPDVILLDIIMPEMDGFEVCRRIKQNKQLSDIPVVFLTALRTSAINRIKALEAGGDGFLSKPVNREELYAEVKAMYKIKAAAKRKKNEKELLEKMVAERTAKLENEIKLRINTDRKLRESEEKYRTLIDDVVDTLGVGVFILDAQFRVVWINEAIENYFGIKRKDVIGKDKKRLIRERIKFQFEDPEYFAEKVLATYENNTYVENFICHMLPGGNREERWLEHWSRPIRSGLYKNGRIEHYTDISDLKKIEHQLKRSEMRYQMISELTSDYVFEDRVLDDGTIEHVWVAGSFEKITGIQSKDSWGETGLREITYSEDREKLEEAMETLRNNQKINVEVRIVHHNGRILWVNVLAFPVWDAAKKRLTGLIGSVKDITEKKKILNELVVAKEKAQESDRLKTAFLQNMSHELRTPLNGILGFSQLLSSENMDIQSIKEYASYIESSGNRLLGLINNIMDISKIEAGIVEISKKIFSLNTLLNEIYQYFKIRFEKKGIELELKKGLSDEKSFIVTNEPRLNQIIMNLMDNALKFTSSGKVTLAYEMKKNELLFSVKDTGMGISPEHHSKVFERFYQVDTSLSRGFEGAGLGLPIAKGLVENLGGRIWLESEVGNGSIFYFTIPYEHFENEKTISVEDALNKDKSENRRKTILIVEDDETSYYFLKILLKKRDYKILHANCGENAVDLCQSNPDIDLVLMDIKMAGMNGLEATKKIKALRPGLPVIAQTAYAFSTDKDTILNAGCDDYITKPIRKQELLKKIDKFLNN